MAEGLLPLVLAPSTFMASTAVPALVLDLKLALAFNRRRVPSGAGPLLDIVLLLIFLLLDSFGGKFLLGCHTSSGNPAKYQPCRSSAEPSLHTV